jgi:Fibrinogen beta and gamma chains, C-terminal globular domain
LRHYRSCSESNLNGVYHNESLEDDLSSEEIGIFWKNWMGNSALKATKMMVRPKDVWFSSSNSGGGGSNEDYTQFDDF